MPNQFFSPEGDIENYYMTEYWLIDQYIGDQLWGWGSNTISSQLGTGDTVSRSTPITTFAGGTNWKQVSGGGGRHSVAIKTDGTLWGWGNGSNGQLGTTDCTDKSTPVQEFSGSTNWRQVSAGEYHTAAIKTDGSLWCWGSNQEGQLGTNNIRLQSTPTTTFAGGNDWKQVSCGGRNTAAIKTDGSLWVWGWATNGSLGNNISSSTSNRSAPITTFAGGTNWKQVSVGYQFMAATKTDGSLWVWGNNTTNSILGNSGIGDRATPITTAAGGNDWRQVFCGRTNVAAIKVDGSLWIWGAAGLGQMGNNKSSPPSVSTPITTFAGGNDWKQVGVSNGTVAAIKTDGSIWTWGAGGSGQIGNGIASNRLTPVTTFTGGNNWKQTSGGGNVILAITSGIDPLFSLS